MFINEGREGEGKKKKKQRVLLLSDSRVYSCCVHGGCFCGRRRPQGHHERIQPEGGSGGLCGAALFLLHLQPPLQAQHHLDRGPLLQPGAADPGQDDETKNKCLLVCLCANSVFRPLFSTQVIVYDHGQVIEDPALTGRVGFTGKGSRKGPPLFFFLNTEQSDDLGVIHTPAGVPWSADIVLNDTRVSDAGTYRCMVNNPPETPDPGIGELELSVVGTWVAPGQPGGPSGWGKTSVNHAFLLSFLFCLFSSTFAAGVSVGRGCERGGQRDAVLLRGGGDPHSGDPLD